MLATILSCLLKFFKGNFKNLTAIVKEIQRKSADGRLCVVSQIGCHNRTKEMFQVCESGSLQCFESKVLPTKPADCLKIYFQVWKYILTCHMKMFSWDTVKIIKITGWQGPMQTILSHNFSFFLVIFITIKYMYYKILTYNTYKTIFISIFKHSFERKQYPMWSKQSLLLFNRLCTEKKKWLVSAKSFILFSSEQKCSIHR